MSDDITLGRRHVVRTLTRLGGLAMLAAPPPLGSCDAPPPTAAAALTRVALAELTPGQRVRVLVGGRPIELIRTGGGVFGRSLTCTHFGCEVRWHESEQVYRCLCHDGTFDAEGKVMGGPPKRPLRTVPVHVDGNDAVIG